MAVMKTSNSALNVNSFRVEQAVSGEAMTLPGTVTTTGILLIFPHKKGEAAQSSHRLTLCVCQKYGENRLAG